MSAEVIIEAAILFALAVVADRFGRYRATRQLDRKAQHWESVSRSLAMENDVLRARLRTWLDLAVEEARAEPQEWRGTADDASPGGLGAKSTRNPPAVKSEASVAVPCFARQYSDQMACTACGMRWDVGDPFPPKCPKTGRRG